MSDMQRLQQRLREMYGTSSDAWAPRLARLVASMEPAPVACGSLWDQRDAVLIAYGDHVLAPGERPLRALRDLLVEQDLASLFSTIHLLPFFPASSDDGFSVIDYRAVDPALGDWDDIRSLGQHCRLMFDLVLNHVSQHSHWFQGYLAGHEPYVDYFHEIDSDADVSLVARPRSLPLLTPFATNRGTRHVWTTFSADQIDLNFDQPAVLLELAEVLLEYVRRGARIIRLDAVAYVGKQLGTSCIHLPQAHQVVKFFRDFLQVVAPGVLLLTETNVPHAENISYFGQGDEAHMVYQFSLPPLLLDAWLNEDAGPLVRWLADLQPAPPGTTFFNFSASHDGIGVRPLEGLVSGERFNRLIRAVGERGGMVSTRRMPDGTDAPYELNITYFDALSDPSNSDNSANVRRFLATQALMLALRGIPGIYFSSLFGTKNDLEGVRQSGQVRRINRKKFDRDELTQTLSHADSHQAIVLAGYRRMLVIRRQQPAFHPDGAQQVLADVPPWLVALLRTSPDGQHRVLVLVNVSGRSQTWRLPSAIRTGMMTDLLTGRRWNDQIAERLGPYETLWLHATNEGESEPWPTSTNTA
ncbi:MAG: sugar phosphorylase [Planctomycetaceae bacterium]|nr:MAG: sugar phosphorylase [Planctomycetaceae bacterium]